MCITVLYTWSHWYGNAQRRNYVREHNVSLWVMVLHVLDELPLQDTHETGYTMLADSQQDVEEELVTSGYRWNRMYPGDWLTPGCALGTDSWWDFPWVLTHTRIWLGDRLIPGFPLLTDSQQDVEEELLNPGYGRESKTVIAWMTIKCRSASYSGEGCSHFVLWDWRQHIVTMTGEELGLLSYRLTRTLMEIVIVGLLLCDLTALDTL